MSSKPDSMGLEFRTIPAGSFVMGQESGGDLDERPVHTVRITRPLDMGVTPITNRQYEEFDPSHRRLRGTRGFSSDDDEAVVFVSWHDAMAFCGWLSEQEGEVYRLPTEAEWEYACRAGTTTPYWTGDTLPGADLRHQEFGWDPTPVGLHVARTAANPWGLHDMHGCVEEWCHDWYGPYASEEQTDPVGYEAGLFRVTRGGSHNTLVQHLRSANRLGTLPEDKHWLIGFRIVRGEMPPTPPLPSAPEPRHVVAASQAPCKWKPARDAIPRFDTPKPFVIEPDPPDSAPFYPHNHCPSITWCDNGDLLAIWFSCRTERGREMAILASRLRSGAEEWDPASLFFDPPDRNVTGSALLNDERGTLYHLNGLEAGDGWANLALVLRTSTDNGATWSTPRLVNAHHQPRNQVIGGPFVTQEGYLVQPCDAVHGGSGGTAMHISRDSGRTWVDPGAGAPKPPFQSAPSGATIAGIHAGVAQLSDGSLIAFGRGDNRLGSNDNIDERMPVSRSYDMGVSWTYAASPFPPISSGQRLVLKRLREGPLMLVSFTDAKAIHREDRWKDAVGMDVTDAAGRTRRIYGMYAALSLDDGQTWTVRKPVVPDTFPSDLDGGGHTKAFKIDASHAEPGGYLAATQTPDGMIHLISSRLYYRFNLAWLRQPMPAE